MRDRITYISEPDRDYVSALDKCKTLAELTHLLEDYGTLFPDALEQLPKNDAEFKAWRTGLRRERRREFAGEAFMERFGNVLLPDLLMKVGEVAMRFKVPWGCAYLRMKDVGRIRVVDGKSRYVAAEQP